MTESKKSSRARRKKSGQGFMGSPTSPSSARQHQQQQQQQLDVNRNNNNTNTNDTDNNAVNQLGTGFLALGSPKSSCFKSASSRNAGSPNKVHWEKSLMSLPTPASSFPSPIATSPSSESRKMASLALSSLPNHHQQHQHQHHQSSPSSTKSSISPSTPGPINVPNSGAKSTPPSSPSSSSSSFAPSQPAPISHVNSPRSRQSSSSSSSSCSSSSSPTPSLSSSPSFAGPKWQADPPLPVSVPKPPMRWLGAVGSGEEQPGEASEGAATVAVAAAAVASPSRTSTKKKKQHQKQQQQQQQPLQRPLWQPVATRPASGTVAAFPTQMRSGCDASELRALMAPPPLHFPADSSAVSLASIDDADFQMRTDITNQLKALLKVVG